MNTYDAVKLPSVDKLYKFDRDNLMVDIIAVVLIALINPITLCFQCDLQYYPPDSVLYTYQAQEFLSGNWSFTLTGINHVDSGYYLPPLFPALMTLVNPFVEDLYLATQFVSKLSAITSLILIYLIMSRLTNRLIGIFTTLIISLNAQFFYTALSPLTESTFIMILMGLFLITVVFYQQLKHLDSKQNTLLCFSLGIVCSALFLTRQIGFFSYGFVTVLILILCWYYNASIKRWSVLWLSTIIGASCILFPYLFSVWSTTGELPAKQHYRLNQYVVNTDTKEAIQLEKERLISESSDPYIQMLERRRIGRILTPESRELLSHVKVVSQTQTSNQHWLIRQLHAAPQRLVRNIISNLEHMKTIVGDFNFYLFLFSSIIPILCLFFRIIEPKYLIIPLLFSAYIICQSIFGGLIERYMVVVLPLVYMQSPLLLYGVLGSKVHFLKPLAHPVLKFSLFSLFFAVQVKATPHLFHELEHENKIVPLHRIFNDMNKELDNEPVFAIMSYSGWLSGGKYRFLPNDSLEKIAQYAYYTGVKWLLVDQRPEQAKLSYYYKATDWYKPGRIDQEYPDILTFTSKAMLPNGEGFYLFRIIGNGLDE